MQYLGKKSIFSGPTKIIFCVHYYPSERKTHHIKSIWCFKPHNSIFESLDTQVPCKTFFICNLGLFGPWAVSRTISVPVRSVCQNGLSTTHTTHRRVSFFAQKSTPTADKHEESLYASQVLKFNAALSNVNWVRGQGDKSILIFDISSKSTLILEITCGVVRVFSNLYKLGSWNSKSSCWQILVSLIFVWISFVFDYFYEFHKIYNFLRVYKPCWRL